MRELIEKWEKEIEDLKRSVEPLIPSDGFSNYEKIQILKNLIEKAKA